MQSVGYSIPAAIYNVDWAVTQVSHMSMVNCITQNSTSRVALTSCRNAFTREDFLYLCFRIMGLTLKFKPSYTDTCIEDGDSSAKPLGRLPVFYYGVGHMLNDITVSCWFTYLLVFITDIGLSPKDAAIVMLSGQIADAVATIFAGKLIDRFGHFKIWHTAGSVLVSISFSSVFGSCLPCKIFGTHSAAMQTVGYSISAAIYNVGLAVTQVSHMSMVNCITQNSTSRVALTSCRNAFTMIANLTLYGITLVVFNTNKPLTYTNIENQFRWIAYISIAIGCCFVAIFLIGTKEPRLKHDGIQGNTQQRVSWSHWFKKVLYYQVALVYILTRLVTNVSQALLAFYVIKDLQMSQSSKASVPAVIFVCSFIVSVILQEIKWTGNRLKAFFTAGSIIWILSGVGILILPSRKPALMYLLSVTIGVANALMMVTSISMQSVLVGQDLSSCGFVYGSISFVDKILVGLALFVLESYESSSSSIQSCHSIVSCLSITRFGLGLVPAACALLASVVTYTMNLNTTPIPRPLTDLGMS